VAHNGTLIPIPGRDIMAQGWYQGGVSVFDWSDPSHPKEIAFFDRGPMDSTKLVGAGSWSAYCTTATSSAPRSRAARHFRADAQHAVDAERDRCRQAHSLRLPERADQQQLVWPASFVVARAYVDQLARSSGLPRARITATRDALSRAEQASGQARRDALSRLATQLNTDALASSDQPKLRMLIAVVNDLGK